LSAISFAGTARTLVAVGTASDAVMLATTREAAPRSGVVLAGAGVVVVVVVVAVVAGAEAGAGTGGVGGGVTGAGVRTGVGASAGAEDAVGGPVGPAGCAGRVGWAGCAGWADWPTTVAPVRAPFVAGR
jgi:hypothetical protein